MLNVTASGANIQADIRIYAILAKRPGRMLVLIGSSKKRAVIVDEDRVVSLPEKDYAFAKGFIKELCSCCVLDLFLNFDGETINVYIKA